VRARRNNGDADSATLLRDTVYPDEVTHCAAGVRWIRHLHALARATPAEATADSLEARAGADWMAEARRHATVEGWFHELVRAHFRGGLKPPFNDDARARAGFTESWYLPLAEAPKQRAVA